MDKLGPTLMLPNLPQMRRPRTFALDSVSLEVRRVFFVLGISLASAVLALTVCSGPLMAIEGGGVALCWLLTAKK